MTTTMRDAMHKETWSEIVVHNILKKNSRTQMTLLDLLMYG